MAEQTASGVMKDFLMEMAGSTAGGHIGAALDNQGYVAELHHQTADDERLISSDGISSQTSEIAPLQLESHPVGNRQKKGTQEGLKAIIVTSICFAASVTVALILTIYLAPPQISPHAGVVSDSKLCSDLGSDLLQRGGSAVDAAIATVLCVGLAQPQHSGIGGGGYMIVHKQRENTTDVIDFMDSVPKDFNSKSGMSIGVPGMLKGLELAHKKFGKLRWIDVIMPVVEIAYGGINASEELREEIEKDPRIKISFVESSNKMNLTNIGLLLQSVAKEGADFFYKGDVASEIVKSSDDNLKVEDLVNYEASEIKSIKSTFLDMIVETIPSPGGGPVLLLFLNMMENLTKSSDVRWNSTDLCHYIVESMKFAYGHFGKNDPELISKEFAAKLAGEVRQETQEWSNYTLSSPGSSHVSVIGPSDDLVSVTTSLNSPFGARVTIAKYGIILNNHLKDVVQNIEPGKRPVTNMAPTVMYSPVRPCGRRFSLGGADDDCVVGGLGQVIVKLLGEKLNLTDAVDVGRLFYSISTGKIKYDANVQPDIVEMLKSRGHEFTDRQKSDFDSVNVVGKLNEIVFGYGDKRNGGVATIY